MKLVTFSTESRDERLGVVTEHGIVDLAKAAAAAGKERPGFLVDAVAFLTAGSAGRDSAIGLVEWALDRRDSAHLLSLAQVRLRAPIPRPSKLLCLAGNYAEHWREGGNTAPPKERHTPEVFIKPVSTIIGPDDAIRLPGTICTAVDYEGELAVVIGRTAKNVTAERALECVAGYANVNDVSGRRLTLDVPREETARTGYFDWLIGKWFDTFAPFGPFLLLDEIADPQSLTVRTRVNGELRQEASSADMIFTVAETISWISRFLTLQPGDVIATGTPSGVGSTTGTYLHDGDVVEVEVSGLGVLRNRVIAVPASSREEAGP